MPILLGLAPEVAVIAVAVLALLLYLAYEGLRQFLVAVFDGWGSFARLVTGSIVGALDHGYNTVKGWLASALHPVVGLFSHPASVVNSFAEQVTNAAAASLARDRIITQTLIPNAQEGAVIAGLNAASAVNNRIDHEVIPATETAVANLLGGLRAADLDILNLSAQLSTLRGEVEGSGIAGALAGLQGIVGALGAELSAATTTLASQAGGIQTVAEEAAGAYQYTDAQVAAGVATAEGAAGGYTDALRGDAVAGLHQGDATLPRELAPALATVAAGVAAATTFLRECGNPMCDWFHGDQSLLGSIFGDVELAGIIALVAAAVSDPGGVARAASAVAGEVESLGTDILSGLGISVPA